MGRFGPAARVNCGGVKKIDSQSRNNSTDFIERTPVPASIDALMYAPRFGIERVGVRRIDSQRGNWGIPVSVKRPDLRPVLKKEVGRR
jgi:hypothetical protein